jgi:hypothetical protein
VFFLDFPFYRTYQALGTECGVSSAHGRKRVFKNKPTRELEVPPIASINTQAVEVLRVWAAPGQPQQLTLRTTWKDAGAGGLLLADVARHAANAYANEGQNRDEVLGKIRQLLDSEFSRSTDNPVELR